MTASTSQSRLMVLLVLPPLPRRLATTSPRRISSGAPNTTPTIIQMICTGRSLHSYSKSAESYIFSVVADINSNSSNAPI